MAKNPTRPYRGITLAARQDDRRQRLIAAAFTVYTRVGFSGATVRAVCAEAGLTPRYFYESFADPTALLLTTFEAAIAELEAILRRALAGAPAGTEARLRAVLTAYYARLKDDGAVARVFLAEMRGISPEIDSRCRVVLSHFGLSFVEILPKLADAPPAFADGVAGGLNQIALAWTEGGYAWPLDDVVNAAALLFEGVR